MYQYSARALRERQPSQRLNYSVPIRQQTPCAPDYRLEEQFFSKRNIQFLTAEISFRRQNNLVEDRHIHARVAAAAKKWAQTAGLSQMTAAYAADQGLLSYANQMFIRENPHLYTIRGSGFEHQNVFRHSARLGAELKPYRDLMPEDYGRLDIGRKEEVSFSDQICRYGNTIPSWRRTMHHRWHDRGRQDGLATWDPDQSSLNATPKGYDMSRIKKASYWA